MEKNEIFLIHGTDYKEMTRKILARSSLADHIHDREIQNSSRPDDRIRIGIKPNLVSAADPSMGATTHPEIVAGIIEYLQGHGFHRIVILEGSWVGETTEHAAAVCGYDRIVRTYGVEFWDMQKDGSHMTDASGMPLRVCNRVDDIDFLINVPVLKGHCQTKMTCALKNMKGLIPNQEKRRFHTLGLHAPIAHLNTVITQNFIVVDNICGDLDFEDGGNPVTMNRILTFTDPVLCDAFACDLLGYAIDEVPYVKLAQELGVGSADLEHAQIHEINRADPVGDPAVRRRKVVELADAVQEVESCSACYGCLLPALDRLKREGLLEKTEEKICIGQGYRGKTGKLGIGTCTRLFEHSLKGCPPLENEIYCFLKNYL